MKKVLLLLVVVFISTVGFSQVKFGIKGGLSTSNVNRTHLSTIDTNYGARTTGVAGVFARFQLKDKLAFQPELLYSMQGVFYDDYSWSNGSDSRHDYVYKLDYINLPLIFRYYLVEGFSFNLGPQLSYLISAKQDGDYGTGSNSSSSDTPVDDVDVKDDFESYDLGLSGGFGYDFDFGLTLDARYTYGFIKMRPESSINWHNSVFQFTAGWAF